MIIKDGARATKHRKRTKMNYNMNKKADRHTQICDKLNEIYIKKNIDYGNSFGNMFQKLGIISAITRMGDKYYRLESLCTKSKEEILVKDENIVDTLHDIANYAIMSIIELELKEKSDSNKCTINTLKGAANNAYKNKCVMDIVKDINGYQANNYSKTHLTEKLNKVLITDKTEK